MIDEEDHALWLKWGQEYGNALPGGERKGPK